MKRVLLFGIILFLWCAACGQDTILLSAYIGNLKKIAVQINSREYTFLFDTGGGETFISNEIVDAMGGNTYGNVLGLRMSGEKVYSKKCDSVILQIGKNKFFHPSVGVWDIMNVLPKGLPKLDGILSLKTFANSILTIDLASNRLIIETEASASRKLRKFQKIPSVFATGAGGQELLLLIPFFNKHPYWFLFDSGNLDAFTFSINTAKEWGIDTSGSAPINVEVPFLEKRLNMAATVKNIIYDGAVNYAFISQDVYMIDFKKRELWCR